MTEDSLTEVTKNDSTPAIAFRGGTSISADELKAHLASLLRLENVGVLLGSGSSRGDLGGKTIGEIWKEFTGNCKKSYQWLIDESFVEKEAIPNVEELFDVLEIAAKEWERQKRLRRLKKLKNVTNDLKRTVINGSLLKKEFWSGDRSSWVEHSALENHRRLLQRLVSARQAGQGAPWVFTTNYDLAVEWASESIGLRITNGFEGLHQRIFSPHSFDLGYHNLLARGEARFGAYNFNLVKLHGSLNWRQKDQDYIEVPIGMVWEEIELFLNGGKGALDCPIVFPTAAKYMQTVGFVLGELLRRFTDFLSRPQACLICSGYSFLDSHLNQIILRALQNPTLQLVIYLPEAKKKTSGELDLDGCSAWVKKIRALESAQVTIIGGGESAYFDRFVRMLPDPAIYDDQALRIRKTLKELEPQKGCEDAKQ